ncbi:MAG: hypothetical protein JWQ35_1863 [Bacteriovoracaceae bacterium]|nr:hypothetical protein [Bacteriovoracaceae bacterium]
MKMIRFFETSILCLIFAISPAFATLNEVAYENVRLSIVNLRPDSTSIEDNFNTASSRRISTSKDWNRLAENIAKKIASESDSNTQSEVFIHLMRELKEAEQANLGWSISDYDVTRGYIALSNESGIKTFCETCARAKANAITCDEFNEHTEKIEALVKELEAAESVPDTSTPSQITRNDSIYDDTKGILGRLKTSDQNPLKTEFIESIAKGIAEKSYPDARFAAFKSLLLELELGSKVAPGFLNQKNILRAYASLDRDQGAKKYKMACRFFRFGGIQLKEFEVRIDEIIDFPAREFSVPSTK